MKKILIILILLQLYSCEKNTNNPYFVSDEIYNKVLEGTDIIHKEVSKTDGLFYVLNRHDTLIIMSVEYENVINPTFTIKKEGTFYTNCCKIIVTKPYLPTFQIIKTPNKLKQNDVSIHLDPYNGRDYQKGVMYKIKDINHLEIIAKGDLRKFFYPIKEYELIPPPPPKEYLGKPYKAE
ncbi:hypothetical protein [Chryseobacterium rhizosphaerae]|uniref:hypothetical protein n=1 Tax=Chryseobacterium rhizosphaerae TaxID=395937 RepID=UPI0023583EF2|nr:hypothetical protein [Chryseobacterium rhizosphaerae]MDC8099137.1 hypothetical protein [Chryseobacterium rhizosphaerae]